jgi:hypothetical protein
VDAGRVAIQPLGAGRGVAPRGRVDYREVLTPEDFAVYARLRDRRKEIAQPSGR